MKHLIPKYLQLTCRGTSHVHGNQSASDFFFFRFLTRKNVGLWQCVLEPATSGGLREAVVGVEGLPHPPTHRPTRGGLVAFQLLEATPPSSLFLSLCLSLSLFWFHLYSLEIFYSCSCSESPKRESFISFSPFRTVPSLFFSFLLLVCLLSLSLALLSNLGEVGIRRETVQGSEVIPADLFLWTRQDAGRIKKERKREKGREK